MNLVDVERLAYEKIYNLKYIGATLNTIKKTGQKKLTFILTKLKRYSTPLQNFSTLRYCQKE